MDHLEQIRENFVGVRIRSRSGLTAFRNLEVTRLEYIGDFIRLEAEKTITNEDDGVLKGKLEELHYKVFVIVNLSKELPPKILGNAVTAFIDNAEPSTDKKSAIYTDEVHRLANGMVDAISRCESLILKDGYIKISDFETNAIKKLFPDFQGIVKHIPKFPLEDSLQDAYLIDFGDSQKFIAGQLDSFRLVEVEELKELIDNTETFLYKLQETLEVI